MIKVLMLPSPRDADNLSPSGITTVLREYGRLAEQFDIHFVPKSETSYDLVAVHAGMSNFLPPTGPYVAHCHGLYWTADFDSEDWQFKANASVIQSIRRASVVTVPSPWVAMPFQRDMHLSPLILPHGVHPEHWKKETAERQFVLWNKNRTTDVCDVSFLNQLARMATDTLFVSTFGDSALRNLALTGVLPHEKMKNLVQSAHIYLNTTQETFGIGILEAMASSVPVLAFDWGNASTLVEHGYNGYLAKLNDVDSLLKGLRYCLKHHEILAKNARVTAKRYSWQSVMQRLAGIYQYAILDEQRPHDVSVVIPCYNKAATIVRAVRSACEQTLLPKQIVIVNNNSSDDFATAANEASHLANTYGIHCPVVNEERQGVAHARNYGLSLVTTRYACCLDADDEIKPNFLRTCVEALSNDPLLGLAYTSMEVVDGDSNIHKSQWPGEYDYDKFISERNQVPTCAVFRHKLWRRLGGYRQRYAPEGAGAEDANFYFRMGALGYPGKRVGSEPLFRYYLGGSVSGNRTYREQDWRADQPWVKDAEHPLASPATPRSRSHRVRSYEQPLVSVIIPASEKHAEFLIDALDSLEAQSFRLWEAIVICDGWNVPPSLQKAYPFVHYLESKEVKGAGVARNMGAKQARAPYLLFLDADDWLDSTALAQLYHITKSTNTIAYSDYIGHAYIDASEVAHLVRARRLVHHDAKTNHAQILHFSSEFDCEVAQRQPQVERNGEFYIWNLITSLVPKRWHNAINGFDEAMSSWEDWDYWIRMAQRGYCFTRIPKHLVHYRFYTGSRREIGRQEHQHLLNYLHDKYTKEEKMPCSGCGGGSRRSSAPASMPLPMSSQQLVVKDGDDLIMVELVDGNIGDHLISFRDRDTNQVVNYGYRKHGDRFLVSAKHATLFSDKFRLVEAQPIEEPEVDDDPLPPPSEDPPVMTGEEDEEMKIFATQKVSEEATLKMRNDAARKKEMDAAKKPVGRKPKSSRRK